MYLNEKNPSIKSLYKYTGVIQTHAHFSFEIRGVAILANAEDRVDHREVTHVSRDVV